jgi:hypothetical protein
MLRAQLAASQPSTASRTEQRACAAPLAVIERSVASMRSSFTENEIQAPSIDPSFTVNEIRLPA